MQERPGRIEYLYLTPEQSVLSEAVNEAIDNLPASERLRCQTPEVRRRLGNTYLYYPHTDYDERTPPSKEEANLMCTTAGVMCPIAEQCLALGLSLQAPSGVWGGKALVDGKIFHEEDTHG